jgi:RecA/RadA recombinase
MAKKKTNNPTEPASFSKLNDFLNTIAPDGEMLDINPIAKIDEWISTGNYILNAALSGSLFGGLPNRRSLVLAGDEGTGKTFIALSICRNAQKMGYDIIYFDSEGAIDVDFVTRLGVDTSRVRLQPVNTIEEFSHIAAQIVDQFEQAKAKKQPVPKIMVVIDSLGNLSSEKEKEDTTSGSNKRDMTKQQNIRKLFRVNGLKFAKHGIPFVINNHVYDSMSMFSPKEISGGGGVKYNASIIFMLGKGKLEDAEGEKRAKQKNIDAVRVGVTIYVTPIKQRFARPIKVQLHIPFYKKPNPYVGLEKFTSWDACGILRGKTHTEKEYQKLPDKEKKACFQWEGFDIVLDEKTGKTEKVPNGKVWVEPRETATKLVCKHLGGEIPIGELFTDKVFTEEVLRDLDDKIIKPTFMLPEIGSLDDLAEITKEIVLEESEDEDEELIDMEDLTRS